MNDEEEGVSFEESMFDDVEVITVEEGVSFEDSLNGEDTTEVDETSIEVLLEMAKLSLLICKNTGTGISRDFSNLDDFFFYFCAIAK